MVYPSDVMLKIPASESIFFPVSQIVCDDDNLDQAASSTENPILIVEVLSESRAAFDHGGKFQAYMKIQSLREYVLIEQTHIRIDVLSRKEFDADWIFRSNTSLEDKIHFESLNINISVQDIYAKIKFEN